MFLLLLAGWLGRAFGLRVFSSKELRYLRELRCRNAVSLEAGEGRWEVWCRPLSKPMGSCERKMRQRIRRKAFQAMVDLALGYVAGVLPDRRVRKRGVKRIVHMMAEVEDIMLAKMPEFAVEGKPS